MSPVQSLSSSRGRPLSSRSTIGALRIVLWYVLFAGIWIISSDMIVSMLFIDHAAVTIASTVKGWAFVLLTGLLLYILIRRFAYSIARREEFINTLVQTIPDMVWLKDANGVYLTCNPSFEKLFNLPTDTIIGATDYDFLPSNEADFFREHDLTAITTGTSVTNTEWVTYRRTQQQALLETIKTPMYDSDGTLIGVLGIARDITELHTAQANLKEEMARTATILKTAPIGLAVLQDRILKDINPALSSLTGFDPSELIGNSARIFYCSSRDYEQAGNAVYPKILADGSATIQATWCRRDGHPIDVLLSFCPIDPTNPDKEIIASIQDISPLKAHEKELNAAKEAAEAANRAKSDFLAMISHELRTPLNGILGGTQLLRLEELTPVLEEYVEMIEQSAQNQLALVNNMLELTRSDMAFRTTPTPFSLINCIDHAIGNLRTALTAKGLHLTTHIDPQLPGSFIGNSYHIRQIIQHLLDNSIKFTTRGEITITAAMAETMANGIRLRLTVVDTGIGINPEQLSTVFLPFVQGDMSHTRRFGGAGLGLAISKRLVEALDGSISLAPNHPHGTVATVEIPLHSANEESKPQ